MAYVTTSASASVDMQSAQHAIRYSGVAGQALNAGDSCYLAEDGYVRKTSGSVAAIAGTPQFLGLAARAAAANDAVTVIGAGSRWYFADSGLSAGSPLFVAGVAGYLSASTSGSAGNANDKPVAIGLSATDILIIKTN